MRAHAPTDTHTPTRVHTQAGTESSTLVVSGQWYRRWLMSYIFLYFLNITRYCNKHA